MLNARPIIIAVAAIVSGAATARAQSLPPNTLNCADFTKRPDGSWYVDNATFDFGTVKHMTLGKTVITKRAYGLSGADLYDALETKCGKGT
jgi:hypothetical protein